MKCTHGGRNIPTLAFIGERDFRGKRPAARRDAGGTACAVGHDDAEQGGRGASENKCGRTMRHSASFTPLLKPDPLRI